MNKGKWIEEILQSAKLIQPVESDPWLATRIEAKLQQQPGNGRISLRWVYATAAVMLVLLTINVTIWRNTANKQTSPVQQLVQEYDLGDHDFYSMNYSN